MRSLTAIPLAAFLVLVGAIGTARADHGDGFIPGLTAAAIIDQLELIGLDCTTDLPSPAGNAAGTVAAKCVAEVPDASASVDALVVYWEDGRVSEVGLGIDWLGGNSPDVDPSFATELQVQLARTPYDGSDPDAAEAFVRDNVANDDACDVPGGWCETTIGSVRFWLDVTNADWPTYLHMFGLAQLSEPTPSLVPLPDTAAKSTDNDPLPLAAIGLAIATLVTLGRAAAKSGARLRNG